MSGGEVTGTGFGREFCESALRAARKTPYTGVVTHTATSAIFMAVEG